MRECYSKVTVLILVWNLCACVVLWFMLLLKRYVYEGLEILAIQDVPKRIPIQNLITVTVPIIFMPLSGWLADSRFGNFKVFRAGMVVMFVGTVFVSSVILILDSLQPADRNTAFIISVVFGSTSHILTTLGAIVCYVTIFQLGLDQMPDASSEDIISFTVWYFITYFMGYWVSDTLYQLIPECIEKIPIPERIKQGSSIPIWSLAPVLVTSVILCTLFVFGQKWLRIEPKSPEALKNIYRVLKFAMRHKVPIRRSAFTYWEEEIPSRLDLGKVRYGGPFTNEQVEDVKTIFRLLIVFIPVGTAVFSINLYGTQYFVDFPIQFQELPNSTCLNILFSKFTYNPWWCALVALLVYKFIIYRLLMRKLHSVGSSMRRITIGISLVALLNIFYSTYLIACTITGGILSPWVQVTYTILSYSLLALLFAFAVEFTCAQSPYNIRGLMTGYVMFIITVLLDTGFIISLAFKMDGCKSKCKIAQYSVGAGLGVGAFLLQLVFIRWYKMREREQDYNLFHQVEMTFEKYLAQERRLHQSLN